MVQWILRNMAQWILKKKADSVWSKVFAGIILAVLSGIIGLIISFIKQIPLVDLYNTARTNYIQVSYLAIVISAIVLFSLILSIIIINVIRSTKRETKQFNLQDFLNGQWLHKFSYNSPSRESGQETVTFVNCFQYCANNKEWAFILTDIDFDVNSKTLKWTKTKCDTKEKHGKELLKIIDDNTIKGADKTGYVMTYTRICK